MAIPEEEFKITASQLADIITKDIIREPYIFESRLEYHRYIKEVCYDHLDTVI